MSPGLRAAVPPDLPALVDLLRQAGLPVDDLTTAGLDGFLVAGDRPGASLAAAGALEVHGPDGLLRSLAVAPGFAHNGLGTRITWRLIRRAEARGLGRIWLLTLTAADYFPRFGFRRTDRAAAPPGIAATEEFARLCPAEAVCMVRDCGPA